MLVKPRNDKSKEMIVSENERQFRQAVEALVDRHVETLGRRRNQLIIIFFLLRVISITPQSRSYVKNSISPVLSEIVDSKSKRRGEALNNELSFSNHTTPLLEFELLCAEILTAPGWTATSTKASGDQGADVIAEKSGTRIILQCKLYTGTVGNKAVQEAYTAQRHYFANASAVVTNADYSPYKYSAIFFAFVFDAQAFLFCWPANCTIDHSSKSYSYAGITARRVVQTIP
jgi:hypothetical protein